MDKNLIEFICQRRCIDLRSAINDLETCTVCFELLRKASAQLSPHVVDSLIEKCDWNSVNNAAAESNQLDIISELEKQGRIDWGRILYGACTGGHLNLVQQSINRGATITGDALFIACQLDDPIILDYLITLLNNTNFKDEELWTVFLIGLLRNRKMKLAYWLMKKVRKVVGESFLEEAIDIGCCEESVAFLDKMMKKTKNKKLSKKCLDWILIRACASGNLDIVKWGMKHKAQNIQDGMDAAIKYFNTNVIRLMKTYGADDYDLLDIYNNMINNIKPCLHFLFCRDVVTMLCEFIDIDYDDEVVESIYLNVPNPYEPTQ